MRVRSNRRQAAARKVLTKLMTDAFVDIRAATNYSGAHIVEVDGLPDHDRIGLLADLFHNVPGQMEAADGNYQSVLDDLWRESRRDADAAQRWLSAVLDREGFERGSPLFAKWTS